MGKDQNGMRHQTGFIQRLSHSIFPVILRGLKEQERYRRYLNTFILHFRPRNVPEPTLRFTLTWGLGGMAFVLVTLLIGTGLLLKFFYLPFPEKAYESVLYLQNAVLFGRFIRNIHHWSANLLLVVVFLHFMRVFFTGAFHPPRQFNWVIGLGLFFAVLLSNFTGYLLPWDQLSFWAVTISVGMLEYIPFAGLWLRELIQGGTEVGPGTLSNFYAIHTAVLPLFLIFFLLFHFWRVRKAGGVVVPRAPDQEIDNRVETVPTIPNLLLREMAVALALIAFILVISILFNAPLENKANPGLSPNPTKAPWYFMGIQELLLHFHPLFALFVIPLCIGIGLFMLPYLNYPSNTAGIWMASIKGRRMALTAVVFAVASTIGGVLLDEYVIRFPSWMPDTPAYLTTGLIPFIVIIAVILGFYLKTKQYYAANRNEAAQTLFILLLTAFVILTAIGIWFRGPGMKLVWP
jgi:quinol-cytochrome oxidoreductase complex cytochrome b subunit